MNELNATIDAATLKYITSVLAQVDDQAIFEITPKSMSCRITDSTNARVVSVMVPMHVFDEYYADDMRVGVDIGWLLDILQFAVDDDIIHLTIDDSGIHVCIGMHDNSMKLLDPDKLRKPPKWLELSHTVSMDISGRVFKRMAKYLDVIKAESLEIHTTHENAMFDSRHDMGSPKHYHAEADCLKYSADARVLYSVDYLVDIAEGVPNDVNVTLQFGDSTPVLMTYTRYGCEVAQILAPRIETD